MWQMMPPKSRVITQHQRAIWMPNCSLTMGRRKVPPPAPKRLMAMVRPTPEPRSSVGNSSAG